MQNSLQNMSCLLHLNNFQNKKNKTIYIYFYFLGGGGLGGGNCIYKNTFTDAIFDKHSLLIICKKKNNNGKGYYNVFLNFQLKLYIKFMYAVYVRHWFEYKDYVPII